MLMKTLVYSLEGKSLKEIELPKVFEEEFQPALIKRAVLAIQTAKLQPKGTKPLAGRDNSAVYRAWRGLPHMERGINVGHARLPRFKNRRHLLQGRVAQVPQAVGGARAHPPKPEAKIQERINRKEKKAATQSAVACTADKEKVKARGHKFDQSLSFPIVLEDKFQELTKSKDVLNVLKSLKLEDDVVRAKNGRKIRAGKGKRRGRKYKRVKSLLMVTGEKASLYRAARNLEGVEIVQAKDLNAELLAPGAVPGRLTVWTESALKLL
jgi:large subunit ribosomal protein L4e